MISQEANKSRSSLFILVGRKWATFYLKDDNGKLWVELNIVTFLGGVATVIAIETKVHQCNSCGVCIKLN